MSNIFARSPFFVSLTSTADTDTSVKLYIWNGTGAAPANPQYTLSKPIPSSVVTSVRYNISPYICEYFDFTVFETDINYNQNDYANVNQWCNVQVKTYIAGVLQATTTYKAFYGYSLFMEDYNKDLGDYMLEEGTYYYYYDSTGTLSTTDRINGGHIQYITGGSNYTKTKYTNLRTAASWTTNQPNSSVMRSPCLYASYYGDKMKTEILDSSNNVVRTYYFYPIEECRNDVITVDFINRYGAWQRTFLFAASTNSFDVRGTDWNSYPANVNYDVLVGTKQTFNTNYNESISCNSGWVNEDYISIIKQMMNSERILIYYKDDTDTFTQVPVKMRTKSMQKQKHLTEKLINYKIEFDFAFDSLNIVQ